MLFNLVKLNMSCNSKISSIVLQTMTRQEAVPYVPFSCIHEHIASDLTQKEGKQG